MENCIFCKIVAGVVPAEKIYEDEALLGFLDAHPKGPGHTLLIPKAHYVWFEEMPDDLSDKLFRAAKKIAKNMKEKTGANHVQLGIVGKDVPHAHIHLIPRNTGEKAASLA